MRGSFLVLSLMCSNVCAVYFGGQNSGVSVSDSNRVSRVTCYCVRHNILDATMVVAVVLGQTRAADKHGHVGTILYHGQVEGQTKDYYGIDWDEADRGKHNGSLVVGGALVRYFVAHASTSGSFVPVHKMDLGRSLTLSVIAERYQNIQSNSGPTMIETKVIDEITTIGGRRKPIEMVGENKILSQQQWQRLSSISLRRMRISAIDTALPGLEHLQAMDLAGNLLADWGDLERLLTILPNLTHVSLASNRMVGRPMWKQAFSGLQSLNLRQCRLSSFATVVDLANFLPNLQELCITGAKLDDLLLTDNDHVSLDHLTKLDASDCSLTTDHLLALAGYCPNLVELSLDYNPIVEWPLDLLWPQLGHLQLAHTQLADWSSTTERLAQLPLVALRLQDCPMIATMGLARSRIRLVARLAALQQWNASSITARERIDCERQYLLDYRMQTQHTPGEEARYSELQEKHPELAQRLALNAASSSSTNNGLLAESLVTVQIKSFAPMSCTKDPLVRKLPRRLVIGRIQALCQRHFGLDMDLQELQLVQSPDSPPVDLDDAERSLDYYGILDGASIIMKERDVEELQRQKALDGQLLALRITEQEKEREEFERRKQQLDRGVTAVLQ